MKKRFLAECVAISRESYLPTKSAADGCDGTGKTLMVFR